MAIWKMVAIGDTTYILHGAICPTGQGCVSLRGLKSNNEVLFDILYDTFDLVDLPSICTDGQYLYVACVTNPSGNQFSSLILKLDPVGNTVKTKVYRIETNYYYVGRSINISKDSLVISYAIDIFNKQDSTEFLFFDKELNLGKSFKYTYKSPNLLNQISYNLYPTLDGNYITNRDLDYPLFSKSKQLVKFTPSGEVIWQKELEKVELLEIGHPAGLVVMPDSSYITSHYTYLDTSFFLMDKQPVTISKISQDGQKIIWRYRFLSLGHDFTSFLFKAKNIDIIGGGKHWRGYEDDNKYNQIELGWIYRLTNEGQLKWQRKIVDVGYNPEASNLFSGVEQENGDLIFGGEILTPYDPIDPKPTQNCWLLRVDSNGCINPGCLDTIFITSTKPIYSADDLELLIYPNPAHDNITIQIPGYKEPERIYIIDINGIIVKSIDFNVHLNVSDLNTGIYSILFYWKDGKVRSSRFVKIN